MHFLCSCVVISDTVWPSETIFLLAYRDRKLNLIHAVGQDVGITKSKKFTCCYENRPQKSTSSNNALAMSGFNLKELAEAVLPSPKGSVQEAIIKKIQDQLAKVHTCIESNLSSINEKLTSISEGYDSIQLELTKLSQSIKDLKASQGFRGGKITTQETNASCSAESMSRTEANIDKLTEANQQLQSEVEALSNRDHTDFLSAKLISFSKGKMSYVALPSIPDPIIRAQKESVPRISTESKVEAIEQYNRRDCFLFFGLRECENEDCIDKLVENANAMGLTIKHDDVPVSHRLNTRNGRSYEPRPIIGKFTRGNTKNLIYDSEHQLMFSENHNNVFVREQLTKKGHSRLLDEI